MCIELKRPNHQETLLRMAWLSITLYDPFFYPSPTVLRLVDATVIVSRLPTSNLQCFWYIIEIEIFVILSKGELK